ncbi:MAG: CDP-diacylglycerol--serine O-phosphatidyltransferase [Bacteroidetes bacterium 4484_276]|nr:MAG: CDP-diacylglycerol--serine O-phosphatidyltransferase [Bacteroidetes bacterium 4484_276]
MVIKKHIPNFVTCLNIFSGAISIVFAFKGNLDLAAWFIGLAAVFDFLDGMSARLLNAKSDIGLQLDSLADVISFGLAPAVIVFQLMENALNKPFIDWFGLNVFSLVAFILVAFSALRLAKFNIDTEQADDFKGLPTPANALFFASLPLVLFQAESLGFQFLQNSLTNYWVLFVLTIIFSGLLVSNIGLFSMKFKNLFWKGNQLRYILFISFFVFFFLIRLYSLPLIIIFYILLSVLFYKKSRV